MVYEKLALKSKLENRARVFLDTESFEVGVDTICYQSICIDSSTTKKVYPENAQVFGFGGNRTRCTQQGYWITSLVDDRGLLTIVVIPNTILFTYDSIMLLPPHHMDQSYQIKSKVREGYQ